MPFKCSYKKKPRSISLVRGFLFVTVFNFFCYRSMKAEINIPDSLNEITLGQYQEFLSKSKELKGYDLARCTVEVFCCLPKVSVLKISLIDITSITTHLNALFNSEQPLSLSFKLESGDISQEFGFINDLENMSLGEYADLDGSITDWDSMNKAMAVLYRPIVTRIKDKYTITEYKGTKDFAEIMRFMPLDIALGSIVFFYLLANELLKATRNYLEEETEAMISAESHSSISNGDGIIQSTQLLRETLQNLKKQKEFQFPRLSLI